MPYRSPTPAVRPQLSLSHRAEERFSSLPGFTVKEIASSKNAAIVRRIRIGGGTSACTATPGLLRVGEGVHAARSGAAKPGADPVWEWSASWARPPVIPLFFSPLFLFFPWANIYISRISITNHILATHEQMGVISSAFPSKWAFPIFLPYMKMMDMTSSPACDRSQTGALHTNSHRSHLHAVEFQLHVPLLCLEVMLCACFGAFGGGQTKMMKQEDYLSHERVYTCQLTHTPGSNLCSR